MLAALAPRFRRRWFSGVFVIILGVWVATGLAYAFGARGITFSNPYGEDATIDFMRQYDHEVLGLGEDLGLELHNSGGSIVRLEDGLPVLCWICGDRDQAGMLGLVQFRAGDWFYRAPDEHRLVKDLGALRAETREAMLTLAYNRATGERVMVGERADAAEQAALLAARGLSLAAEARLGPSTLGDLARVSMQREGCVIVNLAFVAAMLLWLVVGGLAWSLVRVLRGRRAGA